MDFDEEAYFLQELATITLSTPAMPRTYMESVVNDPDTRVQVTLPTMPFLYICAVIANFKQGGCVYGTGALIADRFVLTAAHNVWNSNQCAEHVKVIFTIGKKISEINVAKFFLPEEYKQNKGEDYAVLYLDQSPNLGGFGFGLASLKPCDLATLKGRKIHVSGYPSDKNKGVSPGRLLTMWDSAGIIKDANDKYLIHMCDTEHGESGGAAWYPKTTEQGRVICVILGVHVHGRGTYNEATAMTESRYQKILSWVGPCVYQSSSASAKERIDALPPIIQEGFFSSLKDVNWKVLGKAALDIASRLLQERESFTKESIVAQHQGEMTNSGLIRGRYIKISYKSKPKYFDIFLHEISDELPAAWDEAVSCPYALAGCIFRGTKEEISRHETEAQEIHLKLSSAYVEKTEKLVVAQGTTIEEQKRKLALLDFTYFSTCVQGHKLRKTENKRVSSYICDVCGKHLSSRIEHWRCDMCDWDCCPKCHHIGCIEKGKEPYKYTWCEKKPAEHVIVKTRYTHRIPSFDCAICKTQFATNAGLRYWCPYCRYQICQNCQLKIT